MSQYQRLLLIINPTLHSVPGAIQRSGSGSDKALL
jgi:hypothetical protein